MGAGGSQEAAYKLKASVPAGTYHFVLDGIIIRPVDVTFDLIWRRGDDRHVARDAGSSTSMPLPARRSTRRRTRSIRCRPAIDLQDGDQLVFRYTGRNDASMQAWIPNGDGALANGRIPNITLPR